MRRLILWTLNPFFLFLIVTVVAAIQSSLFANYPLFYFQPNLVLLFVLWCALKREFIEGGILVLLFGYLSELHSSAPRGLFMETYMCIFLLTRMSALYFNLPGIRKPFVLVLLASILFFTFNATLLYLLGASTAYLEKTLFPLFLGSVLTSLISSRVFLILDRLDWITYKHPKARQLLENDLYLSGEGL